MNKLQPNQMSHRLDNITKLQSPNDKMTLLNLITQEHNKSIHYLIEKDKFKSVLKDLLKKPQHKSIELRESQESNESIELHESSELLHESSESYESSELHESNSEFIIETEIEQIENNLEFDNIYGKKESEEMIYYDPNQAKLKTVAKIMYSKHNLDQLIKKKKW